MRELRLLKFRSLGTCKKPVAFTCRSGAVQSADTLQDGSARDTTKVAGVLDTLLC